MDYPYIFEAGTKAVAAEVNSNFETVGNQVDLNTTAINEINNNLESKANISLNNLNETGLNVFANKNASNFTTQGTTYLSGLGMPSDRYINLTLGASGTTYTAPANGWVQLIKTAGIAGATCSIQGSLSGKYCGITMEASPPGKDNWLRVYIPVRKGQKYTINYTATGAIQLFVFIYSDGVPSA